MPRPRKEDSKTLSAVLPPVRCTEQEKERIRARAAEADLSLSEFIRQAALTGQITLKQGDIDFETFTQLRKIGVNLNQQTKQLNATGVMPHKLQSALDNLETLMETLMEKLRS